MEEKLRTCTVCRIEKELHEFSLRSTVLKTRHYTCKECHKIAARKYYQENKERSKYLVKNWQANNKEKRKKTANKHARKKQREQKQLAVDYKGGKCEDCNQVFPNYCYDFHHIDSTQKEMHMSIALTAKGFEYCKEELDKCVMLCACCHRIRHHGEQ